MNKKVTSVVAVILALVMLLSMGSSAFAAKNDMVTIPIYIAGSGLDDADQRIIDDMVDPVYVTVEKGATVQEAIQALQTQGNKWTVVFTAYGNNAGLTSINGLAEESNYDYDAGVWSGKYWNIKFRSSTNPSPSYNSMVAGKWYDLPVYANHAFVGTNSSLTFTEYVNNVPVDTVVNNITIDGLTLTYTATTVPLN